MHLSDIRILNLLDAFDLLNRAHKPAANPIVAIVFEGDCGVLAI